MSPFNEIVVYAFYLVIKISTSELVFKMRNYHRREAIDDFEIITPPESIADGTPFPIETESSETRAPVKELFDKIQKTDPFQEAVKVVLMMSIPFAVAWSAAVSLVKGLYHRESNEQVLERVLKCIQLSIDSYRRRLHWVDEKLPEFLKVYVAICLLVYPATSRGH